MKKWLALLIFLAPLLLQAQTNEAAAIKWLSWAEALEQQKTEPRKILLSVYTDWCNLCKKLEETSLRDSGVANYINAHFYAVRFNAESKDDLSFRDKTYRFVRNGKIGYHQFAADMLQGRLSFPSIVFLNEDQEVIQSITGYKSTEELRQISVYFGEDHYKSTPWSTFQRTFKGGMEGHEDEKTGGPEQQVRKGGRERK